MQGTARVKEMSLDCANGTTKLSGDGFQRQIVFVAHNKHAALARSQSWECGAQLAVKLMAFKRCQWINGFAVEGFFAKRLIDDYVMFRLAAHVVDAPIDGDLIEPTVKLRGALEGVKALVGFEKDFLGEV